MKTTGLRLKHGQVSETDPNLRFWAYRQGKEYWVTSEKYEYLTKLALKHKKIRYHQNPERAREQAKFYRNTNKDRYLERGRSYDRKRGADPKRQEWQRSWVRRKKEQDPSFAIGMRLRIRLAGALSRSRSQKSAPTLDLLGCKWDFFLNWLESKFQPGMSWENRSQWHIDHIIPCCAFNLADPEQQRKCFHYTNLQPLWARENLSKNGKY